MGYVSTSTANPLGWRALNSQLTQPVIPQHGFRLSGYPGLAGPSGLGDYYPAHYYVPTPMNITMRPQANIYDACPDGASARDLSGLGDFINNIQYLRPGQWRTRDDDFSPIPRIYRPPEGIPLSHYGLGEEASPVREGLFAWLFRRRPRFSGGPLRVDPANPTGYFYPRTPAVPAQFPATPGLVVSPHPGDPHGVYFPRVPTPVVPAWLRSRNADWTSADPNHLLQPYSAAALMSGLGAVAPIAVRPVPVRAPVARPVAPPPPERSAPVIAPISTGTRFPTPVGPARPTPPVIVTSGPRSPGGQPIPTPGPITTPATPATVPPGVTVIGGGMCVVQSSPETGSDISTVPCAGVPGYSAGAPGSTVYPGQPGYPYSGPYPSAPVPAGWFGAASAASAQTGIAQLQAYRNAQALIAAGGTLTPAQLAQFSPSAQAGLIQLQANAANSGTSLAAAVAAQAAGQPLTAAQQAALTAAGYSGGAAAAPVAASDGTTDTSGTADILGWLSQSTLITGVPNWVIAAGGGVLVLWVMNRGKK